VNSSVNQRVAHKYWYNSVGVIGPYQSDSGSRYFFVRSVGGAFTWARTGFRRWLSKKILRQAIARSRVSMSGGSEWEWLATTPYSLERRVTTVETIENRMNGMPEARKPETVIRVLLPSTYSAFIQKNKTSRLLSPTQCSKLATSGCERPKRISEHRIDTLEIQARY